ncbi:MAG: cytochrome c family protein [Candidatus Aminicenantia bacterium]
MKKSLLFLIVFVFLAAIVLIGLKAQEFTYVGVNKCKMCHKAEKRGNQYSKWMEGPHSKAYQSLTTDKAAEIAKKAGLTAAPSESAECLECHSPHASSAPEFKEDSVGCEVCHGPGSEYKSLSTMKDRSLAVEKGLVVLDTDAQKETLCTKCHKADHKYHEIKAFNLQEFWAKIAHPKPGE